MTVVNMHEAKSKLSKLVEAVESGAETEIVLARNGKPAAKIVAATPTTGKRLGLFDGKYPSVSLEEFNATDAEIAGLFYGGDDADPA
jgi:prevent-host-death family protein